MSSQLLWTPGLQGTAEQLNGASFWKVADIAALKAVDTSGFGVYANDRDIYFKIRSGGLYRYDSVSTLTADDYNVVQPTTGSGRWILDTGSGSTRQVATIAALKAIVTTGITYSMRAEVPGFGDYLFDSSSSLTADDVFVIQPTTGSGRWILDVGNGRYGIHKVEQSGHAFNVLTAVRKSGATWIKASANSTPDKVTGVYAVIKVIDANNFWVAKSGQFKIPGHGLKSNTNIVYSSGDVNNITWQSGNTIRGSHDTTGKTLTPITVGDWIFVNLMAGNQGAAMHRGYFKITAKDDTADTLDWTNPDVSSSTYNLSALTDDENSFVVYGAAAAGDVLYLGDTDGEITPFPAHNGIAFPLLTVIDADTVELNIPTSIPRDRQPRTLVEYRTLETPNDADDDYDFLARDLFDFRNPQNWHLKIFGWNEGGDLGMALQNVTHRGGYRVAFDGKFSATTSATLTTKGGGAVAAQTSPGELYFDICRGDPGFGTAEFIYDGNDLIIETTSFGTSYHYWDRLLLRQVDLSSASLKDIGGNNLDDFDVKIVRV